MSENKRRCFVIGPIGKEGSPERKHADMLLNNVIREALKDSQPPYEITRSDEIADPGMITDRIIHEITNAELVIADLTFLNANAFYELGIRHAAEKPVIHFAQFETDLPFDAMAHRAVIQDITSWPGIARARQQIREAAKAIEAPGYRVSNPITQANASFRMLQSADPSEQLIADLQMRVARLELRGWGDSLVARARGQLSATDTFGELLQRMPSTATDVDRMLVAGYFVQQSGADDFFGTAEAYSLLTEHGIKVGNPSQCVKQNLLAKRVFKYQGRFRVSQIGLDYLRQLVGTRLPG